VEDQVPEKKPDGPFWRSVLLYFGLWTLLIGCSGLLIWLGPAPPTSGNCVGPYGVAPCAATNVGDSSKTERAVSLGLVWFVSAVGLVVIMVRDRWQRKPLPARRDAKARREEEERRMISN